MFIEKSLKDYISDVSGGAPTPGGGSVSALAGSLGAALTSMVGNLTVGKKAYDALEEETKKAMDTSMDEIQKLIVRLEEIVDEDTKAFDEVMAAFKLPKETEEDKKARSEAIQAGTKTALEVPLECAKECFEVLKLQEVFAEYGNVNAITDVGVGALLAYAGVEGALFNVKINLASIKDEEYKEKIEKEVDELLKESKDLKEELLKTVYSKL